MSVKLTEPGLMSWASDIEPDTLEQARRAARLPIIHDHVSLMPDAHVGFGSTVGSVIPTDGAVIPAAIGVDIGCGMIAVETNLNGSDLDFNGQSMIDAFEVAVPAGLGKWHQEPSIAARKWYLQHLLPHLTPQQIEKTLVQFGTMGSGNHFLEVCLDERDVVWVVLHSGSRGIGNQLAQGHIKLAGQLMDAEEDPDLAYFLAGTPEFDAYIRDMLWAQDYAMANREQMMHAALFAFFLLQSKSGARSFGVEVSRINCHHNFTQLEYFPSGSMTRDLNPVWITRKGAIKADRGDMGIIPGSMGTATYIVRGKGNFASWNSCSHGAGRRMSRNRARKELTVDSLRVAMEGKDWQSGKADELLDEHPEAYKDIDVVMADQDDLVEIVHTLHQVLNYKGTDSGRRKNR